MFLAIRRARWCEIFKISGHHFLTALHTNTAKNKPNLETFDPQQNRIPVI